MSAKVERWKYLSHILDMTVPESHRKSHPSSTAARHDRGAGLFFMQKWTLIRWTQGQQLHSLSQKVAGFKEFFLPAGAMETRPVGLSPSRICSAERIVQEGVKNRATTRKPAEHKASVTGIYKKPFLLRVSEWMASL